MTISTTSARLSASDRLIGFSATAVASLPALFDLPREFSALGVLLLVLLPMLLLSVRSGQLQIGEPILLIGIMWALAVSFPLLLPYLSTNIYRDRIWFLTSPWAIDEAALWMYRGWAACCLAYWLSSLLQSASAGSSSSAIDLQKETFARIIIGVTGLAATILFLLTTGFESYTHLEGYATSTTYDQIISELQRLSKIYVFLYFYALHTAKPYRIEKLLINATFTAYIFLFAASSSKGIAAELLAMWFLGQAFAVRRPGLSRQLGQLTILLLSLYLVFTFVTAYRQELSIIGHTEAGTVTEALARQIRAAGSATARTVTGDDLKIEVNDDEFNAGSMLDRLALVAAFAVVIDLTGGEPPYENAATSLLTPLFAVLPRDLMGTKVIFFNPGTLAELLGVKFGGFSPTITGSLYWAWGWIGIMCGMTFIGALLAVSAIRGSGNGSKSLVWRVLMAASVLSLLEIGGPFQSLVTSTTRTLLFLIPIFVIASHLANRNANSYPAQFGAR